MENKSTLYHTKLKTTALINFNRIKSLHIIIQIKFVLIIFFFLTLFIFTSKLHILIDGFEHSRSGRVCVCVFVGVCGVSGWCGLLMVYHHPVSFVVEDDEWSSCVYLNVLWVCEWGRPVLFPWHLNKHYSF